MTAARVYESLDGRTRMPIRLDPSGSIFVVFRGVDSGEHFTSVSKDGATIIDSKFFDASAIAPPVAPVPGARPLAFAMGAAGGRGTAGGGFGGGARRGIAGVAEWRVRAMNPAGAKSMNLKVEGIPKAAEISGPWHVAFEPKRGAPESITMDKLFSWSEHPDIGVKYFSGTATYTNKFPVAADAMAGGKRLFLDLGRVQVLAEVLVNGKNLGILWKLPFRVEITDAVHTGDNDLEIRVTNLWPNRLIGDEQLPAENQYNVAGQPGRLNAITKMPDWYVQGLPKPDGGRITFTTWHHWSATDALLESGLIGPVQIRAAVPLIVKQ